MPRLTRREMLSAAALAVLSPRRALSQNAPQPWIYSITDFAEGQSDGWIPGFADFSPETASMNRRAEIRTLPEEVESRNRHAYYLRGRNTSDDLFMFIKKPVTTLEPDRQYDVSFYIEFASSAPSNCAGIGGAPGESVTLKAGATATEPLALLESGNVRLNVDKGNQVSGGADVVVLGNVANGVPCEEADGSFVLLRRTGQLGRPVRTDGTGSVWIFAGTDSGFEGTTEIYYAFIAALFTLRT